MKKFITDFVKDSMNLTSVRYLLGLFLVLDVWMISFFGFAFLFIDWVRKDQILLTVIFVFSFLPCLGFLQLVEYIEDMLKKRS